MNVILQRYDGVLMAVDSGETPGQVFWENLEFKDPSWTAVAFDQTVPYGDASVSDWNGTSLVVNPTKLYNAMQSVMDGVLEMWLLQTATDWGYRNIESLVTYVNSSVPQYKAQATAFIAWRDSLWSKLETDAEAFMSGTQPLPDSFGDYIATFPPAPAKP